VARGEQAEVADAYEASRQNMQQETAEEFVGIESHGASAMPMGVVSPQEADFVIGHRKESRVGDGNAVGIAREVGQDLRRAGKRSLGIDDPVGLGCGAQQSGKQRGGWQRGQLAGESKRVFLKGALQSGEELPAKDDPEYFDGEKELVSAGNPSLMIWGKSSAWDHAMHMGMSTPTPTVP